MLVSGHGLARDGDVILLVHERVAHGAGRMGGGGRLDTAFNLFGQTLRDVGTPGAVARCLDHLTLAVVAAFGVVARVAALAIRTSFVVHFEAIVATQATQKSQTASQGADFSTVDLILKGSGVHQLAAELVDAPTLAADRVDFVALDGFVRAVFPAFRDGQGQGGVAVTPFQFFTHVAEVLAHGG